MRSYFQSLCFVGLAIFGFLASSGAAFGFLSSSGTGSGTSMNICDYQYDEYKSQGYVITDKLNGQNGCNITYRIEKDLPASGKWACDGSVIPENYVVTQRGTSSNCKLYIGQTGYAYYVRKPYENSTTQICPLGYAIPEGYVINQKGTSSYCDKPDVAGDDGYTYYIVRPNTSAGVYTTMCDGTPAVPDGFAIVESGTYSECRGTQTQGYGKRITVPRSTGQWVCEGSAVPSGYVVTEKRGNYYQCSNKRALHIQVPSPGSSLRVCDSTKVPDGFVIRETGDYYQCAYSGTAPGYFIGPLVQGEANLVCEGFPIPSGYVIQEKKTAYQCRYNRAWVITQPNPNGQYICDSQVVPPGFVITNIDSSSSCAYSGSAIRKRIKVPQIGETLVVCDGSPIPEGFGYRRQGSYAQCSVSGSGVGYQIGAIQPGYSYCASSNYNIPKGFVISSIDSSYLCDGYANTLSYPPASGSMKVCNGSPMPDGYVLTARGGYSECGTVGGFTISIPAAGQDVCVGSPVPEGFAVSTVKTLSVCGSGTGNAFTLINISGNGPYYVCQNSDVPEGYVITSTGTYLQCNAQNGAGMVIEKIDSSGTMTICSESTVPSGYRIFETIHNYADCDTNGSGTAYVIKYVPSVLPAEFVNEEPNGFPSEAPAYLCGGEPSLTGFIAGAQNNQANCAQKRF